MKHAEISLQTKKTLAAALKRAMGRKPFGKITVSELIQDADVNRKTFYYHFTDIYDLLRWTLEEEAVNVVKHFDLESGYESAIRFILDYVEENDHLVNCAVDALGREGLKRLFESDMRDIVGAVLSSAEKRAGVSIGESDREFLVCFYEEALGGLLMRWIQERGRQNRETVERQLIRTIRLSLEGILSGLCSEEPADGGE